MGTITKNGKGFDDLTQAIVEDVEQGVKDAQKAIDKMNISFNIPDITKWRTPLVLEHDGKVTVHGETNPHLSFSNTTNKN